MVLFSTYRRAHPPSVVSRRVRVLVVRRRRDPTHRRRRRAIRSSRVPPSRFARRRVVVVVSTIQFYATLAHLALHARATVVYRPSYTPFASRCPTFSCTDALSFAVIRRFVHEHFLGMYRSTFSPSALIIVSRARGRRGGAQDVEWGRRGAFGMVKARSGEIARVVRVMRRANACTDESTLVCFPRIGRIRLRHRLALAKEEGGHQPSVSVPECALHSMVSGGCGDDDRRDQTGDELDIDFANQSQVSYI